MSVDENYPRGSGDPNFSKQQIFALISSSFAGVDTYSTLNTKAYTWQGHRCSEPRLWRVQSRQRGVIRDFSINNIQESLDRKELSDRLADRTRDDIDYQGQLPLELSVSVSRGVSYGFRLDANQSVEVYASCVNVNLLAPGSFALVPNGETVSFPGVAGPDVTVTYFDAFVGVDIQMVDSPLTQESTIYTQILSVSSETAENILIPERAVSCEIVTDETVSSWGSFIGDPSQGRQMRSIPFTNGVAEFKIGNETMLQTDSETGAREFRLRWKMKP